MKGTRVMSFWTCRIIQRKAMWLKSKKQGRAIKQDQNWRCGLYLARFINHVKNFGYWTLRAMESY